MIALSLLNFIWSVKTGKWRNPEVMEPVSQPPDCLMYGQTVGARIVNAN